jgi:hypothetical protein
MKLARDAVVNTKHKEWFREGSTDPDSGKRYQYFDSSPDARHAIKDLAARQYLSEILRNKPNWYDTFLSSIPSNEREFAANFAANVIGSKVLKQ